MAVDESAAKAILAQGAWRAVAAAMLSDSDPFKSQCVWLPVYLVTIPMTDRGTTAQFPCTVDGLSGAFALFAMPETITEGTPPGESFPPSIPAAESDSLARAALTASILRRRRKSATARLGPTESIELLRWPYWVFYYRRRKGIDIRLVDAATGDRPGHKIKLGLLEAFRAAARNQPAKTEGEDV